MRKFQSLILQFTAAATLAFSGCTILPKTSKLHNIKVSTSQENADLFQSIDDMAMRISKLQKGMADTALYDTLGVSPKRFSTVPDDQKMKYVDGPQIPQPDNADEQDKIKARADGYTVRILAFRSTVTKAGISITLATERRTTGYDVQLIAVFKDGKLDKTTLAGIQEINRYSKETIAQLIGAALKGASAGAMQKIISESSLKVPGL